MTTTNETLVRLDCIGRIRFSRAQRDGLLDAYESSGLSGPQFAAQHGVKYQTFATWLQARKRACGQYPILAPIEREGPAIFAEVERSLPETATVIEISLPGGSCLTIRHASQIALVARLIREAVVVAFCKHTLLSLDDCLYALQATIPNLSRSSLHRCFLRHGITRLPELKGNASPAQRKKFKAYPIGYFHIDIAEISTAEGKLFLFVAIDRTSKFTFVRLVGKANIRAASDFLAALIEAIPYRIHTVLTDNGIQFADLPKNRQGPTALYRGHPFDRVCLRNGIEHRLTKLNHPWTNGQVERMNRTIKEATVKIYHYDSHEQLSAHLGCFLDAYNFGKRLKTLAGLTPYQFICSCWQKEPDRFISNPFHLSPGLNT